MKHTRSALVAGALSLLAPLAGLWTTATLAQVPYGPESVAKGKALFLANCTQCHGQDGKSQVDVVSDATDLTEPLLYRNGTTDADIETSIRDGRGGVMPPWGAVFNNADSIAHLRNFTKSLWPADKRPK